jgi:hypothetical protein
VQDSADELMNHIVFVGYIDLKKTCPFIQEPLSDEEDWNRNEVITNKR